MEVFVMYKGFTQMVIKAYYLQSIQMLKVQRVMIEVTETSIRDT